MRMNLINYLNDYLYPSLIYYFSNKYCKKDYYCVSVSNCLHQQDSFLIRGSDNKPCIEHDMINHVQGRLTNKNSRYLFFI